MYAAESEVVYQFRYRGESYSVPEDDLLCCYPSLSGDGSYFFTLKDGTFLRGEQVKEMIRKIYLLLSVTVRTKSDSCVLGI